MVNFIFWASLIWGVFGVLGATGHFIASQANGFGLASPIAFWSQVLLCIVLVVSAIGFKKRSALMARLVGFAWVGLFLSMALASFEAYKEFNSLGAFGGLALFSCIVALILKGLFSEAVRKHLMSNAT
ncbi:hypothetical protein [Bowmanella yangjiangensis]|uniref:Uncharacterized protein n=1 Tax=Bowmanella yangjiangensis TaxID=2811230 RepID=A0ABS3CRE7_9ALTE|nr:hypothetical protein [Bowmanella yangjiangensis]MBN7819225.1 hypothetical protein [Bowmanella yangjiangensis]